MVTAIIEGKLINRNKAIMLVFVAAILWSTSGLFIKLIDINPFTIAGTRGGIAAVLMLALMHKNLRFNWSLPQVAGAMCYAGTMITFVVATVMTTAANAILLQYTMPVFTALFGLWILEERVSRFDWGVTIIVVGGMALFFLDKLSIDGIWGNIIAIVSAITFALLIIFMRMQKSGSPVETIILGNVITALVCLPFIIQEPPSGKNLWPLFYLGIFQLGLPFILYSTAIKYITALDAVLIQTIEPLLNPIWVFMVIGEAPGLWAVVGGAVVLTTVTVRNVYSNPKVAKEAPV